MAYPTLERYQEALQHPSGVFLDPELKMGHVTSTGLGMPLALCGGFALTYTIKTGSKKYAVRCFHKESKALEKRYQAISKKLKEIRSPYFLDFEFQPQGIRIEQQPYPVVKMAWASGETLGEFLDSNRKNKVRLDKLATSLSALAAFLDEKGIAHGDIQTGNLMVAGDGAMLQVIDYDGMYVDEIKSLGGSETGQRNFQHPDRSKTNPFDPALDRFSFIALTLAVRALEAKPDIWDKTRSDIDGIVFRANDYVDPQSSIVFSELSSIGALGQDIRNFAAICAAPYSKVPTLEDFLARRNIPQATIVISTVPRAATKSQVYISAYSVLDATDYALCLMHVGDRIELIGQIVEVKEDLTRHRKPYVFINFGPWQGKIVKISIWSEGLSALASKPDQSWIGKWISVVGLMEPPYVSRRYNYSHLAVSITQNNQLTIISADQAKFRLSAKNGASTSNSSNIEILKKIGVKTEPRSTKRTTKPPFQPPRTSNQELLDKMRGAHPPTQAGRTPTSGIPGSYSAQGPKGKDRSGVKTVLGIALAIAIAASIFARNKGLPILAVIVIIFLMSRL